MTCPTRLELLRLIEEILEEGALSEVVLHLETCRGCQQLLEDLTNVSPARDRTRPERGGLFLRRRLAFAAEVSTPLGWPAD